MGHQNQVNKETTWVLREVSRLLENRSGRTQHKRAVGR